MNKNEARINALTQLLDNDFRKNKRLDGEYTDTEWEEIAAERRAWRQELRELLSDRED